jgi:hypothetical protein
MRSLRFPSRTASMPAMTARHRWLIGAVALLLFFAYSLAHAKTDPATTEQLMRKSGLWSALKEVGPQIQQQIQATVDQSAQSLGRRVTEPLGQRLTQAAEEAYEVNALRNAALARIGQAASPAHARTLIDWFAGPLGSKIIRYEEASGSLDPAIAQEHGNQELDKASPKRRAQLQRIIDLTQAAELATRVAINTTIAIQVGASTSLNTRTQPNAERGERLWTITQLQTLRETLDREAPAMKRAANDLLLANFALTYSAFNDAELQRYITFLSGPAGRHFSAVALEALDGVLTQAAVQFGRLLTQPANTVARI